MLSLSKNASASATAGRRCAALAPAPRRPAACRSGVWSALYELAKAGDVDAPPEVLIGGAIVVTLVSTALIPLVLKPGACCHRGEGARGAVKNSRRMVKAAHGRPLQGRRPPARCGSSSTTVEPPCGVYIDRSSELVRGAGWLVLAGAARAAAARSRRRPGPPGRV